MSKAPQILTVDDVIAAFGGTTPFSKVIEKGQSTASEMKRNKSIHVRHWEKIIEAARHRKIRGITWEALGRMHAQQETVA